MAPTNTLSTNTPMRPYISRVMSSEIRRARYVSSGLSQLEAWAYSSHRRPLDTSAIQMHQFVAQSSGETPFERFLAWDPVEDPNVLYARPAIAEAIRRNAAVVAAPNALPEPDGDEHDATEDEQDDREDDADDEEMNDDGSQSDDDGSDSDDDGADSDGDGDDAGGIQIEGK
ncbi:hypothetical protein L873DRAFT_1790202 [Choiromyces venosus 120613-1]|uniref:Uncharacterized protein n=1 Tax=Choiromyces venosus 120613-1 TaxID=1336337 RepID=A0A3N4JK31_9PEZI|nr:hypothetical protein L873DRAFT_1790202 [Choiromyces venosus 120613-1]